MKKHIRLISLLLAVLFMLAACGETTEKSADGETDGVSDTVRGTENNEETEGDDMEENKDTRYGTALNIDPDALAYMYNEYGDSLTTDFESKVRAWYEDRYADCGISDILYNICFDEQLEKYYRKTETLSDGTVVDVDYTDVTTAKAAYLVSTKTDVDPYAVWFEQCRADGINPWLSFRMNDVHSANNKTGHSAFYYTAKKNGWLIGDSRISYWLNNTCTQGSRYWYPNALDYSVPEVRQHFLDGIDKYLGKYDAYGIELDWQRTIWCFANDDVANCQYMNLFMEEVNKTVAKYEEKYGHEIKISARINRDIDENKYFGFDVVNWAKNDWIDVVIPASYWGATDTSMPIAEWKTKLEGYEVDVWAGLECHVMNNSQWQSIPTLASQTASYLSAGADKIYLYNLFNDIKEKFEVCASLKNALAAAKRSYVVTRSNTTPVTAEHTEYVPLPMKVIVNERSEGVLIEHGALDYEKDTVIYVGISGAALADLEDGSLEVSYNGVNCTYRGTSAKSYIGSGESMGTILEYLVPKDTVNGSSSGLVRFNTGVNLTVNYIELTNGNTRI